MMHLCYIDFFLFASSAYHDEMLHFIWYSLFAEVPVYWKPECKRVKYNSVNWHKDTHCSCRLYVKQCCISSGSEIFAKIKQSSGTYMHLEILTIQTLVYQIEGKVFNG